ncbi:hypothetical protein TWF506_007193 [Arthrobotrys conoides]|uniref:C2H2-type domain-containing protein n=1 Tax=Arthrobotrys conoides TaxID=74498 RepID=A0AAN8NJV2_9PEZI
MNSPAPTYPTVETAAAPNIPLYDDTPSPRTPLSTNVKSPQFDISGGVVPSPLMTSPTLSLPESMTLLLSNSPHQTIYISDESPRSQPEPLADEDIELGVNDFGPQIKEIDIEQARKNRAKRRAEKEFSRSEKKKKADETRVKKNASGVKPRKNRKPCPEPNCRSSWSNMKGFQNHLGSHDIRLFVCELCPADFPRFDNAINHLKTKLDMTHTINRQKLLAIKRSAKQLQANSQSSESPTPSYTSF